jgi:23S rRNA (cytidine1920-2'-O)/16S rRNA (cytidine1409-2'-O)-methyltransferase
VARRERLDRLLVLRGLAETRERAHALVLSGAVRVDGSAATKPALLLETTAQIELISTGPDYVSRGALKLEAALTTWQLDPSDRVALDVGASTGGFTDLLLRRGAVRVYAVDVGYGQLHARLRADPRVIVLERTNVRYLDELPETPDVATIDVAFISLRLALPPLFRLTAQAGWIVALVKPQFEAGRTQVRKGVVRDPAVHQQVLNELTAWSQEQPWRLVDSITSPIRGPAGNVEFLSRWAHASTAASIITAACSKS